MPFVPFHELCPEVAFDEMRSLELGAGAAGELPAGVYNFVEMYCDEEDCDCRRVFFMVVSQRVRGPLAVIAWGWETRAFYRAWLGFDDPRMVAELKGPALNLGSPQSRHAQQLLELVEDLLLSDPAYVERIQRHYALFRAKIDGAVSPRGAVPAERKGKRAKGWWRKRR